ncbi:hypothetical protein RFI_17178, partial [Reticulomyxa filosa]
MCNYLLFITCFITNFIVLFFVKKLVLLLFIYITENIFLSFHFYVRTYLLIYFEPIYMPNDTGTTLSYYLKNVCNSKTFDWGARFFSFLCICNFPAEKSIRLKKWEQQQGSESDGHQLKKFMQNENVWDLELFNVLLSMEIKSEDDIEEGSDIEFLRQKREEIKKKNKKNNRLSAKRDESLARLNKLLSNFEKIWRKKSGIKVTNIKGKSEPSSPGYKDSTTISHAKQDAALQKGKELKKYMQAENIWDVDLFMELVDIDIIDEAGIAGITQVQFDEFEKIWRKASGIKRTNITSADSAESKERDDERSSARRDDALKKGQELKKYMQKENVWDVDLFIELVESGVTQSSDIASITQTQFDEVCRKTRVIRISDNNDVSFNANLEKLLTKFEKIWRQASGIKRTNITSHSDHK